MEKYFEVKDLPVACDYKVNGKSLWLAGGACACDHKMNGKNFWVEGLACIKFYHTTLFILIAWKGEGSKTSGV